MGSNKPIFIIMIIYIVFCKVIGPIIMKNREPIELKKTMTFYNVFQIVLNTYLSIGVRIDEFAIYKNILTQMQKIIFSSTNMSELKFIFQGLIAMMHQEPKWNYRCENIHLGADEQSMVAITFWYIYVLSRITDLLDTVIISFK